MVFFLLIFEKNILRKLIFYLLSILLLVLLSCKKNQGTIENYSLFESKEYKKMDSINKLSYLDSINSFSSSLKNDSINRIFLFNLSSEYYYLNASKKSFTVCKNLLELSTKANDTLDIARSYNYMGDCYETSKRDSAYYYYQRAEKLYRLKANNEKVAKMIFNKAYMLYYEGNYLESEIMVSDALQLIKNSDDTELLYTSYTLMGSNFEKLEEYDSSLKYYLLAKKILPDLLKNDTDITKINNYKVTSAVNIATINGKKERFDSAKKELESVLTPELKKDWQAQYATVIGNLGYIKLKSGNLKGVEALFKEALKISINEGNESSVIYKYTNLGEYYAVVKDTTQSIHYLKKSLQLAEKQKSSDDIKNSLKLLSVIDNRNAPRYDKRYIILNDSLVKAQRNNRNKFARIEYETSVVEEENKILSTKNKSIILGFVSLVIVLIGIIIYRYVKSKKQEIVLLLKQQKAEEEIFKLLQENQIKMNLVKVAEQKRISRELHDGVLNKLYGTRMQLGILNESDEKDIKAKRLTYVDLLQDIEKEIRDISHDLHSDIFNGSFDYINLLKSLINEQNELNVAHFSIDVDSTVVWKKITGLVKITIYRIVQEAIQNVIKHANAKECRIEITNVSNKEIHLTIEDNGVGFDSNKKENKGIGLRNINDRAKTLSSKLKVTSDLGTGTKIEVAFKI
jgi:signal transduction histidine kinase